MTAYHDRAVREMTTEQPSHLAPIFRKLVVDSRDMLGIHPEDARARAQAARAHAVLHLDELHAQVREQFERRGIGYHRAATAEDAVAKVRELLGDARRVAKSKTMVGEEIGLTHALRAAGIDVLETDIGEYIVDIEGRGPSHITAPALHLNRARIREMLMRTGADLPDDDPLRLSLHVRDAVGAYFADCDAGITGANAVVASSGRLVIVENEGNVSLGASHPKLHIAVTGLEKVIADEAGALAVLEVLAPSATAQPLTSFTHFLADPAPGQQRHVVFVDNGRSQIAASERYRDILRCIRCGACMNACPVYRVAGGLSYGSPYMGPIGAVLSPLLWRDGRYADLPFASSLCGRCTEVCPVGIPLHRQLLDLRALAVDRGRVASRKESIAWKAWTLAFTGATRARAATALARIGLRSTSRVVRPQGTAADPRLLPDPTVSRDPSLLQPAHPPAIIPLDEITPAPPLHGRDQSRERERPVGEVGRGLGGEELRALFTERATALGVTVTVTPPTPREGDRILHAAAAIAVTGSVVLKGDQAARRPLLAASRLVVHVDPTTIIRYVSEATEILAPIDNRQSEIGNPDDALILTGASRTADIEKQIVRGIHGPEELLIVLAQEPGTEPRA
ncbi:MAG: LUD domain-containing protein [Dehalococcoidia bacterium]